MIFYVFLISNFGVGIFMNLKVKDLKTGKVHRLKTLTKTFCGIDIACDESRWCIVGSSEKVSCQNNKCKKIYSHRYKKSFKVCHTDENKLEVAYK